VLKNGVTIAAAGVISDSIRAAGQARTSNGPGWGRWVSRRSWVSAVDSRVGAEFRVQNAEPTVTRTCPSVPHLDEQEPAMALKPVSSRW